MSEDLNEQAIVAAAAKGTPKAEFLRDLIRSALNESFLIGLSDQGKKTLEALATVAGVPPNEFARSLLESALTNEFSMLQRIARTELSVQFDDHRRIVG